MELHLTSEQTLVRDSAAKFIAAASINVMALSALFSHAVELTNHEKSPGPESSRDQDCCVRASSDAH